VPTDALRTGAPHPAGAQSTATMGPSCINGVRPAADDAAFHPCGGWHGSCYQGFRQDPRQRTGTENELSKAKYAVVAAALAASGALMAQGKPPEPDYTLSYNIGAVTDYRYRGISQSRFDPALQGGIDFAHKSGFYLGTWASTISWIKDAGTIAGISTRGPVEWDLYGGYKGTINDKLSYDVGGLYYWYVGNTLKNVTGSNADTFELYGALTYGPATLKYSHSLTDLFGTPNSDGSGYLDLSATFDTGFWGLSLTPHVGHQRVANNSYFSYTDWSLTLGKDFGHGVSASLAYVDTNARTSPVIAYASPGGKNLGRSALVAGLKYSF
jgi:uncharacterized protein (TIGR02001 family)